MHRAVRNFAIIALLSSCALALPAQIRSSARKGVNKLGAPIPDPMLNGKKG